MKSKRCRRYVLNRALDYVLRKQKQQFSAVFYDLHCQRMRNALNNQFGFLSIVTVIAGVACLPILFGNGYLFYASCAGAIFVLLLISAVLGIIDNFRAQALPYFERRLNGTDTWLAGKDLLWNSHALDEIAVSLRVTPLCDFVSGDPLRAGEMHDMFEARDALTTCEALLNAETTARLGAQLLSDLSKLRDALIIANESGVQFSLHLREGSSVSGQEMDLREGSYF